MATLLLFITLLTGTWVRRLFAFPWQ